MVNLLFTEYTKLKRSPMTVVFISFVLLPPLLETIINMGFFNGGKSVGWFDIFATYAFLVNLLLAPPCYALMIGFIFSREYQENTVNYIFISPYSRLKIYVGKCLLLFCIIISSLFISYALSMMTGLFLTQEHLTVTMLRIQFLNLAIIALWQFALCFIALVPALLLKISYPSMIVGAGGVAASIMTLLTSVPPKYSSFNPYYFPAYIVSQLTVGNRIPDWILWRGIATLLMVCLCCLCITLYSHIQSDKHSGS